MASSSLLSVAAVVLAAMVGCATGAPNITASYGDKWLDAKATWYGNPQGGAPEKQSDLFRGPDEAGDCAYKDVDKAPFDGLTASGNEPIFRDALGCGSCYEIKCTEPAECSGEPVSVKITDKDYEDHSAPYHFGLSGKAFGALAKKGQEDKLRKPGELMLQFRRVKCKYPAHTNITFHVEQDSNPNDIALLIKYVAGDGNIVAADIKEKGSDKFLPMKLSWGAIWRIQADKPLKGPFSIRLTTESGGHLVQDDVIPADFKPEAVYTSKMQFGA